MTKISPESASPSYQPYADTFEVGSNTLAFVTRMRQPVESGEAPSAEPLVGDILRRTCKLAGDICAKSGCQAPADYENTAKLCSDRNLSEVIEQLSIDTKDVLMVGVTADKIGYYDDLSRGKATAKTNSVGMRELPGYNAFFARHSENVVLGARLADCGFAVIEFKDRGNNDINGFVHLTRTNLRGDSNLEADASPNSTFTVKDKPAGSFEYYLHEALNHYKGEPDSVRVRLVSATNGENLKYTFQNGKHPEDLFPGWYSQGMLINTSNPEWRSTDPVNPQDLWEPQYLDMFRYQIRRSGLAEHQITDENLVDPSKLELGHASNNAGAHGKMPDGRDAYLVVPRSYRAASVSK